MQINIKRVHEDAYLPSYAHTGDSGFDLHALEDIIVEPGQTIRVRTGLAFEIPDGFELQIRPRSGVSAKTKLRVSNSPATIDASYRGEVMVLLDNIAPLEYELYKDMPDVDAIEYELKVKTCYAQQAHIGKVAPEIFTQGNLFNTVDGDTKFVSAKTDWVDYHPSGSYLIRRGDRICQGVIAPVIHADIIEVDELSDTTRGDGSFGSTGTR